MNVLNKYVTHIAALIWLTCILNLAVSAFADSTRTVPADTFQVNVLGNHVNLTAPGVSSSYSLALPPAQGAANQAMVNDGSGSLSWIRPITGLTGDVTATGAGVSVVATVGGQTAANVAAGSVIANAASSAAVNSAVVRRDGSGNFAAGTITASLSGNASTATTATTAGAFSGSLSGDVTGTQGSTVVALVGGQTASAVSAAAVTVQAATNAAVNSTLVKRDASGNFAAGTITANLAGNASGTAGSVAGTNITGQVPFTAGGTNAASSQAAINNLSQLTTKGDIEIFNGTNTTRFPPGADGTVLSALASASGGLTWISPLTNPMTTVGDLIVGGTSGAAVRLAVGTSTKVLFGGSTPSWAGINLASGAGVQLNVGQIAGTTTNDNASAGNIGEYMSAKTSGGTNVSPAASGSYVNIATIILTPGDWDVSGGASLNVGSLSAMTFGVVSISTTTTGQDSADADSAFQTEGATNSNGFSYLVGPRRVVVATGTTQQVWLTGRLGYTTVGTASWDATSKIWARRRR